MADTDILRRYLAYKSGSGLEQQMDPAGGNRLVNQVTDAYAQSGDVIPAPLQDAMRELNQLTQRESELAGASPGARAYLGADGYDPLTVKRRASELTDYIYTNSAQARNVKENLAIQEARQNIRQMEEQNQFSERTQDDRVAAVALQRRAHEIELAGVETAAQQADRQRAMLDYVAYNNVSLDVMRQALEDGSSNALEAAFGTVNRLDALSVYNVASKAEDGFTRNQIEAGATAIEEDKQKFINEGFTMEQAQQMLAGDIPIPNGYSRAAVNAAKDELASTTASMVQLNSLAQAGITSQKELEDAYLGAMNSAQLQNVVDSLAAMPKRPADGMVQMALPDGRPVNISIDSIMNQYQQRSARDLLKNASAITSQHNFDVFSKQLQESRRQVVLARNLSGVIVPQSVEKQMQLAWSNAAGVFQASLAETDPAKKQAMQEQANQIANSAMTMLTDELKKAGTPQYIIDDLANGKFMSDHSYRQSLGKAFGFGPGGMARSPLSGVVAGTLAESNQGWMSKGLEAEDFRKLMTPDKDGNYPPLTDFPINMEALDKHMTGFVFEAASAGFLNAVNSDPSLLAMVPEEGRASIQLLATGIGADGKPVKPVIEMSLKDRVDRMMDVLSEMDRVAISMRKMGSEAYADYQPGQLMAVAQSYMNDGKVLQEALNAPDGVPDRTTAAVLELWLSYRNGTPLFGKDALRYEDIVPTVVRESTVNMFGNMAGRVYDQGTRGSMLDPVAGAANRAVQQFAVRVATSTGTPIPGASLVRVGQPLFTAATGQIYMKRLASEGNAGFLSIGRLSSGVALTDNWNVVADPEEVWAEAAKIANVPPDQLADWIAQQDSAK